MKKLVKIIQTNEYQIIDESQYNPDIHIDRTYQPIYLDMYSHLADYITIRNMIHEAVNHIGGFNNIRSDEEKDIVLKYTKIVDVNDAITYFMSKGMTQEEAQYKYILLRSNDIRNTADCFKKRISKPEFTATIIKYLGTDNAEIFMDNCRNFLYDLTETAIIGTEYGNTRNGIMDYINDTGDYVGTGLSTFFTLPDEQAKFDAMRNEIENLILG